MGKKMFGVIMNGVIIAVILFFYIQTVDAGKEGNSVDAVAAEKGTVPSFVKMMAEKPEVTKVSATPLSALSSSYRSSQYVRENLLSSRQKDCYDHLYSMIVARQTADFVQTDYIDDGFGLIATVDVSPYHLSLDELFETWSALLYDHVELFWIDETMYTYTVGNETYMTMVCPREYNTYVSRQKVNEELDYHINVLQKQMSGLSEEEGAIYLCKYLASLFEYAQDQNFVPIVGVNSMMVSSIQNRTAICAGYSRVYAFLYRQLEPGECLYVSGEVKEGYHAWNYVCVDCSRWYAVDATFYDGGDREVLLAGKSFLTTHSPDVPGLVYLPSGLAKFGYPLPELETYGYFEKQNQAGDSGRDGKTDPEPQNDLTPDPVPQPEPIPEIEQEATGEMMSEQNQTQDSEPDIIQEPIPEPVIEYNTEPVPAPDPNMGASVEPVPTPVPDPIPVPQNDSQIDVTQQQNTVHVRHFDKDTVTEEDADVLPPEVFHDLMWQKYFEQGCQAQKEGKLAESIELYKLALFHREENMSMYNMANAYRDMGMYGEAVKWYLAAYAHGDGEASIDNCVSMIHNASLDTDTKLDYLNEVVNTAPFETVYSEMAMLYDLKGEKDKATDYRIKAAGH